MSKQGQNINHAKINYQTLLSNKYNATVDIGAYLGNNVKNMLRKYVYQIYKLQH